MKAKKEPKQIDKFKQFAKEQGCDEDEKNFKEKFKKVVKKPNKK